MTEVNGADAITAAIESSEGPAICAYVTAGYPRLESFPEILRSVASAADVVEVGVPFTDPMADGLTIQKASHVALANGVSLPWILETIAGQPDLEAPVLLMGYYNPFLAFGLAKLGKALTSAGVSGLIVPDAPLEESGEIGSAVDPLGLALVQLVTPTTPPDRLRFLAQASSGFVYAVTTRGVTGGNVEFSEEDLAYLGRVRDASSLPVMAGFGIRRRAQVEALAAHVDGVVVGSALIDAIENGEDPGAFLDSLRPSGVPA
jgi:tryptophan synthase alpha chain